MAALAGGQAELGPDVALRAEMGAASLFPVLPVAGESDHPGTQVNCGKITLVNSFRGFPRGGPPEVSRLMLTPNLSRTPGGF